jgi:hypothetical protein
MSDPVRTTVQNDAFAFIETSSPAQGGNREKGLTRRKHNNPRAIVDGHARTTPDVLRMRAP